MLELKPFGPVHKNAGVTALVVVCRITVSWAQVMAPPVIINSRWVIPVTVVEEVLVQPLIVLVTFRV